MSFEVIPACDLSLADQASLTNRAFAEYVAGWANLDAAGLARFVSLQGADLAHSRFLRDRTALAGFGYITRTGTISRLSAMAFVPTARGTGAASHLLLHLLEEARGRKDCAMVLEVIEQNPRAHRFYQRHGFREIARLEGWRGSSDQIESAAAENADVEEISIQELLHLPAHDDYPTIPWQISRYAIAKVVGARAFRTGKACVAISDPESSPIRIYGLISASGNQEELRATLAGTMRCFPAREFFAPPLFPADLSQQIFHPLGFRQEPISQFLMRRDL